MIDHWYLSKKCSSNTYYNNLIPIISLAICLKLHPGPYQNE